MPQFLNRRNFGQPQMLAALLLLVFVAESVWLTSRAVKASSLDSGEIARVHEGLRQWHGYGVAGAPRAVVEGGDPNDPQAIGTGVAAEFDHDHSPLWYLVASAPSLVWPQSFAPEAALYWAWLARIPFLVFGVLLGASLWYVARRLYGDAGGYIALGLYCFSPEILRSTSLWVAPPEMGAAWGAFGAIFTAVAVSHTLYAPREVVLWNWRRIVLLGLSFALAIGSQFSLIVVVPLALAFMLYLAPTRRKAALGIWGAACVLALVILYASYFAHPAAFWNSVKQASFLTRTWQAFAMGRVYLQLLWQFLQSSPALAVLFPAALVAYVSWRRIRYFGNTAPLLVALLFIVCSLLSPHYPGFGFQLMALPFLFVFVAGVSADLLETRYRDLVLAVVGGTLVASALWNVLQLVKAGNS
ncbi:MAG: hypothetical protein H0X25_04465 [Acidobacteriales bacterium]|nr:hypothetical protein [Terriglobales bacterium]